MNVARMLLPLPGLVLLAGALYLMGQGAQGLLEPPPASPTVIVAPPEVVEVLRTVRIAVPAPPEPLPTPEPTPEVQVAVERRLVTQVAAGPALVGVEEFYRVIARTPWPDERWPDVWALATCEAGGGPGLVAVHKLGDLDLVTTGPSYGALMINIQAHPRLLRTYNLLDLRENLLAGYVVWLGSGRTFIYDWKHCADVQGLR